MAHKLHRYVDNPLIPLKYAMEADRASDIATEENPKWLVQYQMLFTWLLSESMLPCILGCNLQTFLAGLG